MIRQCYDRFISDRMVYCADKTIRTYTMHLELFLRWLSDTYGPIEQTGFEQLPPSDNIFTGYILYLRTKGSCKKRHYPQLCPEHQGIPGLLL